MISSLFIILLAGLGLYFLAMNRIADRVLPARQWWHLVSFALGLLVTLATFIPSPDLFGPEHRFTVSMGQMLLVIDVGPLLLFSGIPAEMLQPLQQRNALIRNLFKPYLVGIVSAVILWSWFVPALFEAASQNLTIWILKQILFLISGLLLWWPLASPISMGKPSYPVQLLYLFIMRLPMTILGIIFTFADKLIYISRSFSLEICAPSSISDQQIGGLVIWMIGGLIIIAILTVVFFRWFNKSERQNIRVYDSDIESVDI